MRTKIKLAAAAVLIASLAVYLLIIATVTYVGVMVTYVFAPIILVSGLLWWFARDETTRENDSA